MRDLIGGCIMLYPQTQPYSSKHLLGKNWFICLDRDIFKVCIWSRANNMGCSRPDSMGYFLSATMLGFSQHECK